MAFTQEMQIYGGMHYTNESTPGFVSVQGSVLVRGESGVTYTLIKSMLQAGLPVKQVMDSTFSMIKREHYEGVVLFTKCATDLTLPEFLKAMFK